MVLGAPPGYGEPTRACFSSAQLSELVIAGFGTGHITLQDTLTVDGLHPAQPATLFSVPLCGCLTAMIITATHLAWLSPLGASPLSSLFTCQIATQRALAADQSLLASRGLDPTLAGQASDL